MFNAKKHFLIFQGNVFFNVKKTFFKILRLRQKYFRNNKSKNNKKVSFINKTFIQTIIHNIFLILKLFEQN